MRKTRCEFNLERLPDRVAPSVVHVPTPIVVPVGPGAYTHVVPIPYSLPEEEGDPEPQPAEPPPGHIILPKLPPSGPVGPG
jgi:hypothetical protein